MPSRHTGIVSAAARLKSGERGRVRGALVNGFGALCLAMVLLVILYSLLFAGPSLPALPALASPLGICAAVAGMGLILLAVWLFTRVVADCAADLGEHSQPQSEDHIVIVPVRGIHPGTIAALDYARSLGDDIRAVYVETDTDSTETMLTRWGQEATGIPLIVLDSPRRTVTEPLLAYIDALERGPSAARVTVVLPELVTTSGVAKLLPGPMELVLKGALLSRERASITSVRRLRRLLVEKQSEPREAAGQQLTVR